MLRLCRLFGYTRRKLALLALSYPTGTSNVPCAKPEYNNEGNRPIFADTGDASPTKFCRICERATCLSCSLVQDHGHGGDLGLNPH